MFNWSDLQEYATTERMLILARAAAILVGGLVASRVIVAVTARMFRDRVSAQGMMILRRLVFWTCAGLVVASTLHQLGFRLGVLLGAAGVLTVAIGFASQTSVSNLISGLFVIAERSFVVGDVITIGNTTGEVLSIDLLSIKLRTFDNLLVRVPNENVIKTEVKNLTHFPIRRFDMQIGVAYKEDMARVREVLDGVVQRNPNVLEEPAPLFIFQGYGDSALEFQFSVWMDRKLYLEVRNKIMSEIKVAFDEAGIEIPFPHRSLYAGSVTEPFPVRIIGDKE